MLRAYQFQLVIYDEVENFPDNTSPNFYYPFDERKSQLYSYDIDPTYDLTLNYLYYFTEVDF